MPTTATTKYSAWPCFLCQRGMNFREIREGVHWTLYVPLEPRQWEWMDWFGVQPVTQFAHRTCWKQLDVQKRNKITKECEPGYGPRTMEQTA